MCGTNVFWLSQVPTNCLSVAWMLHGQRLLSLVCGLCILVGQDQFNYFKGPHTLLLLMSAKSFSSGLDLGFSCTSLTQDTGCSHSMMILFPWLMM